MKKNDKSQRSARAACRVMVCAGAWLAGLAMALEGASPSAAPGDRLPSVRLSPRIRAQLLPGQALPVLEPHRIEPFLTESQIVDEDTLRQAPRIVGAPEGRVLITRGDRAYARGPAGAPLLDGAPGTALRIVRDAQAVRDPATGVILGYEAHFLGRALLLQPQGRTAGPSADTRETDLPVPAVLDVVAAREDIRAGDRLLPDPPREFHPLLPRAAQAAIEGGRIAAMHGDAVGMTGQNQVVVINKGRSDGLAPGDVLALLQSGRQATDPTTAGRSERMQLPDDRNGLLMVFRTFDRLSYALILETRDGVAVGDRVVAPR